MGSRIYLSVADYVVILGYCVLVVGIGLWFRKRLTNVSDYFAGGHQLPWWLAGISHYMSSFSAFSFIAYTQIAYLYGFTAVTLFWASVPACIMGGLVFAKRWRRARVITPVEFLRWRYDTRVQQLCAWAGIPVKIFDDALKIFATGVFVSVTCGSRLSWSVVICAGLMVSYSFFGGLWALVVTDYVQFLMKSLAILLLIPLAIHAAGGLHAGFHGLPAGFLLPVNKPYTWTYIVGFTLLMMLSYNASWSLAQKYYSTTDERAAEKAAYLSAGLNFLGAPLMIAPGILARHFLPGLEASGHSADTYVLILARLLPEGMVGIILAAMLSATMASVSADFNAIASVLTQDIYHRIFDKEATDAKLFQAGRLFTVALGAITTLLCLWIVFSQQQALFNLMVMVFGVFLAPTLMPILAALVTRRVTTAGALCGFVMGLTSSVALLALKMKWPAVTHLPGGSFQFEGLALLLNLGCTLLGLLLGSRFGGRSPEEAARAEEFEARLQRPVSADESAARGRDPMGMILPVATASVTVLIAIAGAISHSRFAHELNGATTGVFAVLTLLLFRAQRKKQQAL